MGRAVERIEREASRGSGGARLGEGPVGSLVLRQGLPVAIGMTAHGVFNLVDLAMVGRVSEPAVAGVHCATTVGFLPMVLGNAFSIATMSQMSRHLGAGRRGRAARVSSWSQAAMLVFGLVLGVLGALLAGPSIGVQGLSGEAYDIGVEYLVISHLGTFSMFALMQATTTMRALGVSVLPAVLLIGANILNILLDIVLIFGWEDFGIPAFGAVGAAYASVSARILAAAVAVTWIAHPDCRLRLRWVGLRPPAGALAESIRIALPGTVQMLVRALVVIVLTRMTADFGGAAAVVAIGVTTRLDAVVLFLAIGYAGAATTVVGHAVGARDDARARAACRHAGFQALVAGGVVIGAFIAWGPELMRLFVADATDEVVRLGVLYLTTAALGQPLAAFCIAVTGGLHGAGQTVRPLLVDLGGLALGAAAAAVWAYDLPIEHLWWGFFGVNALLALAHWAQVELGAWTGRLS